MTTFDTLTSVLDWLGIATFAVTGALVASRKEMDIVGFILLGTVTGIGGGTMRDMLLGNLPVFWIKQPAYLVVCILVSAATFFFAHIPQSRYRMLLWFDAVGMAVFAVGGTERALQAGAAPVVAVAMGVITATFGSIIRDVLGNETPVILRREIYVTAALAGAVLFVSLSVWGAGREVALASGVMAAALIRFAALRWNWSLPRYQRRAGGSDRD